MLSELKKIHRERKIYLQSLRLTDWGVWISLLMMFIPFFEAKDRGNDGLVQDGQASE